LLNLIFSLLNLYTIIILIRVLSSWIPNSREYQIVQFLIIITEPLLGRLRKILPQAGGFDLSPIAAIFLLEAIASVLKSI
jgi:YggT family protein|tara:strand:- start:836 stop:1075 length:240 start_codon:yes stop_codon:yes gene_type:complete